ncbi:MAG: DUF2066 domain-containing protein [Pseudomonadota bacterium]
MNKLLFTSFFVSLLSIGDAQARDVVDLYQASIPVADRGDVEFSKGLRRAMRQVLVKLTGTANSDRRLDALVNDPDRYVLKFAHDVNDDEEIVLRVEFDPSSLSGALESSGVSIWGKERPDTLLWLVIDAEQVRQLSGADEPGRFGEVALTRAKIRGIPILLPLMDVEESQHLIHVRRAEDVVTNAHAMSRRYGTSSILIGYVRESVPGIWEAQFTAVIDEQTVSFQNEGSLPELLIEEGIDRLTVGLANRYAGGHNSGTRESIVIRVEGVQNAGDYARATHYLESLDIVSRVFVSQVAGRIVDYQIVARGGQNALSESISFGRLLTRLADQQNVYRLNRN